ncbi:MAG TPA: acyl carrier protein [Burkholderiales bacterium]|nr:acyl carrier protein [Burkholderiales bacterium]
MSGIESFIENFNTAVDFQEAVELKPDTALGDLPEWDSLAALAVIVMFDLEYGVTITGNDLKGCTTLQDVHKLLGNKA